MEDEKSRPDSAGRRRLGLESIQTSPDLPLHLTHDYGDN
ncbi:unnamed protein product, partial [Rotaria magnacalcarata]